MEKKKKMPPCGILFTLAKDNLTTFKPPLVFEPLSRMSVIIYSIFRSAEAKLLEVYPKASGCIIHRCILPPQLGHQQHQSVANTSHKFTAALNATTELQVQSSK